MDRFLTVIFLSIFFALSAGLAIGLTFLPCYATLCSEDVLPKETRIHTGVFFLTIATIGGLLLLQSSNSGIMAISNFYISRKIPILGKHVTVGGLVVSFCIIGGTFGTTGLWLSAQLDYWGSKTDPLGWDSAKTRLTASGVTGHYADILLGLLVIPVSRNSLVGQAFGLHQSTLLYAHKLLAYLFVAASLAHGVAYALYAMDTSGDGIEAREQLFTTGNPTMTVEESKTRSSWYKNTTYTGVATIIPLVLIAITAIPFIRRQHYNVFYYSHILLSIPIFIGASIHASTDFYFLFPGLVLWLLDWAWRLLRGETGGWRKTLTALVEDAGNGWYRIVLPSQSKVDDNDSSTVPMEGTFSGYPLMCYYLNIPAVSRIQNHAFTAAVPSSEESGAVFLFQRTQGKSEKRLAKEWTWKLGSLVANFEKEKALTVRVEGPYPPRDTRFESASHIICIVGGTGITGAYSLAVWWLRTRALVAGCKFTLIWTMRGRETASIKEWAELEELAALTPSLVLRAHFSSETGRLDPLGQLRQSLDMDSHADSSYGKVSNGKDSAWVYSSGPDGLLDATQNACIVVRQDIRNRIKRTGHAPVKEVNWYVAKWEL